MSYNQPPPQPGPYGQQPQQPGPYGAPPPQPPAPGGQPGSPGYGYPQQPPPGPGSPYGPPQPPGPYGGQPGDPYGGQVPPPPGGGGGKGKVIGIIVAVVLVLGLAGGGVYYFTQDDDKGDDKKNEQADDTGGQKGGGGDDGGQNGGNGGGGDDQKPGEITDDGKQYKLTLPETIAGGQFKKMQGEEASPSDLNSSDQQLLDSAKVTNPTALRGIYFSGSPSDPNGKSAIFFGAYGDVADPEASVDSVFAYVTEQIVGQGATQMVGSPEAVQPEGFQNGIMKCQLAQGKNTAGEQAQEGICVWADNSTVTMLSHTDGSSADNSVDLNAAAKLASDIRNDIRVER